MRLECNPAEIENRLYNVQTKLRCIDFKNNSVSAVLFLLSGHADKGLSLILTKRSNLVSQPGDLCSPGGSVSLLQDRLFSCLLQFPGMPLRRWRKLHLLRQQDKETATAAILLTATALRESWEEIGLSPRRVQILGMLEPRRLTVFDKTIFPVCGWIQNTGTLKPNREVESIHRVPITDLLNPRNYAAYLIQSYQKSGEIPAFRRETICYRHREEEKEEILWGASLGVALSFLKAVYGFTPPARDTLPLVKSVFSEDYFKKF